MLDPVFIEIVTNTPKPDNEATYRWLFHCIERAIRQGKLKAGSQLPASRVLAEALSIARNTVKTAYEMLLAEGYIESKVGSGSYVSHIPLQLLNPVSTDSKPIAELPLSSFARQFKTLPPLNSEQRRKLQPGIPALDQFPLAAWKRCLSQASSYKALESCPPAGNLILRREIAEYLHKLRGIKTTAAQVLITSGSQQAIYLVARLLLNAGDAVIVETPGYPGISGVFSSQGCRLRALNMNDFSVDSPPASLISLTPSRGFPLGYTLSLEQRLKVVHWAEQMNSWILEDDYDSEFAQGHPVSALHSMCGSDRVIYMGTFSHSMFHGLRLGYMVLPAHLMEIFTQARRYMDGGLSQVVQFAMAEFMGQGLYARHLKKMRKLYADRSAFARECIRECALVDLEVLSAPGGIHLVLGLPNQVDDRVMVNELNQRGYGIRALSGYCAKGQHRNGLVIGFCADDQEEIRAGFAELAEVYTELLNTA